MVALTKKDEKLIISLQQKKFRKQEALFVVEGEKMVQEALQSNFEINFIVSSIAFESDEVELKCCDEKVMQKISSFKTAPGILAVIQIPSSSIIHESDITLLLDRVQDPGNLGTIIRTADAFGVKSMICSEDTVDVFSPKVVQASMGSIFRMGFYKCNLKEYLASKEVELPIYAAHLKGENLYQEKISTPCYLMVGNESQGINDDLLSFVNRKVKIPMQGKAESFNVSIATAIILSEFRRQLS